MTITEKAKNVTNGHIIIINYDRPVKTIKGSPVIRKAGTISFTYDNRTYYDQIREENGVNMQPVRPAIYSHIKGLLYSLISAPDKLYIRFNSRESLINAKTVFTVDGEKVKYSTIEKWLYSTEKKRDRKENKEVSAQMNAITSTGNIDIEYIQSISISIDNITELTID
jgi:hypothetical protein